MTAARIVLMVLLTVSLDLAVPFVPTAGGLQWDDDEEAVHLRRSRAGIRLALVREPSPQKSERGLPPAVKVARPSVPVARLEWLPLLRKTAAPSSDSASPPEPH